MLVPSVTGEARADNLLQPANAADIRAASGKGSDLSRLAKNTRFVRVNRAALARHVAPLGIDTAPDRVARARALDGVITIELFPGTSATFRRRDVDTIGDSGYAWTGQTQDGARGSASLIVENGQVNGDIRLGRRVFRIAPVTDGIHRVTEIDPTGFPPD